MLNLNILTLNKFPQTIKNLPIAHIGFFLFFFSVFLTLSLKLVSGLDFNDETEKYIVSELISNGHLLYKDIFVQHAPVPYMLSNLFHSIFGFHGLGPPRAIPIALSIISIFSVIFSPILKSLKAKFFAGSIMTALLSSVLANFGLIQTMYQVYAGYLAVISFSLFLIPLIFSEKIKPAFAFYSGFCNALIFFCGFSFLISFCIFYFILFTIFLSSSNLEKIKIKQLFKYNLFGIFVATFFVFFWLSFYGDIFGYFVAHIYFNLHYYSHYLSKENLWFNTALPLVQFIPFFPAYFFRNALSATPYNIWHTIIFFSIPAIYSGFIISQSFKKIHLSIILFISLTLFFIYFNPRLQVGFGSSTIVIVSSGLIALIGALVFERTNINSFSWNINFLLLLSILFISIFSQFKTKTWLYELSPFEYYKRKLPSLEENSAEMNYIRSLLNKNDGILSLTFDLTYYYRSGRIPSFGIFYWMPWMNDYSKQPILNYPYNLCELVKNNPPKIINYDNFALWSNPTDHFMGCIKSELKQRYVRSLAGPHLWIRSDIFLKQPEHYLGALFPSLKDNIFHSKPGTAIDGVSSNHMCINYSSDLHDQAKIESCNNPNFNYVGMHESLNGIRLVGMAKNIYDGKLRCMESTVDSSLEKYGARFWQCSPNMGNQLFKKIPSQSGFKLQNKSSKLCLSIDKHNLIQTKCGAASVWNKYTIF